MALVLCSYSGIQFNCDHFPIHLTHREYSHPIFHVPQKTLLSYTGKWAAGSLTTVDSYLLFLALLNSTEQVEFRVPAHANSKTHSIIAQSMEHLTKAVSRLNAVSNPHVTFARYVIGPETKTLENVPFWIKNWMETWEEFQSGYRTELKNRKLITRESALERLIRSPHISTSEYAAKIADWAAIAGDFPSFMISSPYRANTKISIWDYWRDIIIRCARNDRVFAIPSKDLQELLDHCVDNISAGTIFADELFRTLRSGIEKQKNYLGLGDIDLSSTTYQILSESDSTESANIKAMIDSAPAEEPRREQYPTNFAFFKAKMRWNTAMAYRKNQTNDS